MASYPLINGLRYDWSSLEINLNGTVTVGAKELSYSDKLEPGDVRGTSAQIIGRTRGEYSAEGSITMFAQEFKEVILDVLGDGYMEKAFDLRAHYADANQPTVTDTLVGCRIKNVDASFSQGSDPLLHKLDLHIMYVLRNGVAPISNLRK